jgi:hypothetical protein
MSILTDNVKVYQKDGKVVVKVSQEVQGAAQVNVRIAERFDARISLNFLPPVEQFV